MSELLNVLLVLIASIVAVLAAASVMLRLGVFGREVEDESLMPAATLNRLVEGLMLDDVVDKPVAVASLLTGNDEEYADTDYPDSLIKHIRTLPVLVN